MQRIKGVWHCVGAGEWEWRGGAEIVKQGSGRGEGVVDKRNYIFGLKGKKGVLLVKENGNAHWGNPQ